MRWLQALARVLGGRRLSAVADQLARQAQPEVWQRVARRVYDMTAHEAAGYIRAHAALVLDRHVAASRETRAAEREGVLDAAAQIVAARLLRVVLVPTSQRHTQAEHARRAA